MLAVICGPVIEKSPQEVCVDVGGLGYRVFVPLSTYYGLPDMGREVRLFLHTHVREEAIHLFGFLTRRERELFRMLLSISKVGPRLALAILSGLKPDELTLAVNRGDVKRLASIPGVGKKTAQRLVMELKDRLAAAEAVPEEAVLRDDLWADGVSALVNLGYPASRAEAALAKAAEGLHEDHSLEELIRESLKILA